MQAVALQVIIAPRGTYNLRIRGGEQASQLQFVGLTVDQRRHRFEKLFVHTITLPKKSVEYLRIALLPPTACLPSLCPFSFAGVLLNPPFFNTLLVSIVEAAVQKLAGNGRRAFQASGSQKFQATSPLICAFTCLSIASRALKMRLRTVPTGHAIAVAISS